MKFRLLSYICPRRDGRAVDCSCLENSRRWWAYRGFESLSLRSDKRHFKQVPFVFIKYFVYILYSLGHDRYYIGQTNDLTDWLSRHNELIDLNVMYWNIKKDKTLVLCDPHEELKFPAGRVIYHHKRDLDILVCPSAFVLNSLYYGAISFDLSMNKISSQTGIKHTGDIIKWGFKISTAG